MIGWFVLRDFVISNKYLYAFVILSFSIMLSEAVFLILSRFVKSHLSKKSAGSKIIVQIENPIAVIIVLLGLDMAIGILVSNYDYYARLLRSVIVLFVTFVLMRVAHIGVDIWSFKHTVKNNSAFHSEILPLIKSIIKILFMLFGSMVILKLWDINVLALMTSLGIAGAIAGLSMKSTLESIFSGISLIMDNTLKCGEVIEVDNQYIGEVLEINLRSTKIKTFDNTQLVIPNSVLAAAKITNYHHPTSFMRLPIDVAVVYGSDMSKVRKILLDATKDLDYILEFPKPYVIFHKLDSYFLKVTLYVYIDDVHVKFKTLDILNEKVYNLFEINNIEFAFPTYVIKNDSCMKKNSNSKVFKAKR